MRVADILSLGFLQAVAAFASPPQSWNNPVHPSPRPDCQIGPHHPGKPLPPSPDRKKVCVVQAQGNGSDDSKNILRAIKDCNNGGHVVFPKDQKFTIGTALDLTFLKHIDLGELHNN